MTEALLTPEEYQELLTDGSLMLDDGDYIVRFPDKKQIILHIENGNLTDETHIPPNCETPTVTQIFMARDI